VATQRGAHGVLQLPGNAYTPRSPETNTWPPTPPGRSSGIGDVRRVDLRRPELGAGRRVEGVDATVVSTDVDAPIGEGRREFVPSVPTGTAQVGVQVPRSPSGNAYRLPSSEAV